MNVDSYNLLGAGYEVRLSISLSGVLEPLKSDNNCYWNKISCCYFILVSDKMSLVEQPDKLQRSQLSAEIKGKIALKP